MSSARTPDQEDEDAVARASASHPSPQARVHRRRARLMGASVMVSLVLVLGDAMLGGPWSQRGLVYTASAAGLCLLLMLIAGSALTAYGRAFEGGIRPKIAALVERIWSWTWGDTAKTPQADRATTTTLERGDRITLVAGLMLTALDVLLTLLLLRDVFPEPPYRFDAWGMLSPAVADWSFYLAVAMFKTALELWFGMIDESRQARGDAGSSWAALRWFVLGGASAFDALLAVSRGMMLSEQGIEGAGVMVSNLVFVGFGLAVPWVAARTGGLLVHSADPLLARLGPVALIGGLFRIAARVVVWAVALVIALPALVVLGTLALGASVWSVLEDLCGVLLGHEDAGQDDAWQNWAAREGAGGPGGRSDSGGRDISKDQRVSRGALLGGGAA